MTPWQERALLNGYKSSAAFPLKVFGNTIGVLNIYSDETNYFNNSEIKLLEEMSLDISFALEFIQHENERRIAEIKLQESNDLLVNLAALVPGVIYQYRLYPDGHSQFPYSSPGIFDIYEVKPEDVIEDATPVFGRLHPEDFEHIVSSIQHSANTLEHFHCEFRVILPNQGLRWRLSDAVPQRMDDGSTLWHGIISDITDQKLIEIKLENERIRLRTLIETIPDLIWLKDPDGVYITCNPKFERFFGAKETEIRGKTDYDFLPVEFADFFRQKDKEAQIANKPRINLEWVTFADDGHKEFLETIKTPMYDSQGILIGILGISRNITEQHKVLEDLRLTTERLRVSLKNSNIVVAITNTDLRYEWIYNTHPEFPDDKVIGLRDDEISQCEGALLLIEMKKAILKTGKGMRNEFTFLNSNVEETFDITGEPLFDSDGKIIGITTASLNITDRKKAELELIRARKKAEESDRLKSNFLANMSHELRTPMVGILGFSQLLVTSDDLADINEMADLILTSSKRLMETLNLILDLSSIEAGESGLELIDFDILVEINNSLNTFHPLALKKNLAVIVNCNYKYLQVHSSKKAVESILNNLISNAIKFTNEGSISITINTVMENSFEWVIIEVTDTGIGIDEKNYEHIFKEFRQVSEGFGRSHEGTGLGLTLTKKYVDIIGGSISLKSKINNGTTFTVRIPVITQKTKIMDSGIEKNYETINDKLMLSLKSTKKVLVVEDDMVSNYLVKKYLQNICEIDNAVNAKQAIEKAKMIQYDAILMDINLGKSENGIYATKQIRMFDNYKNIPIIAMTAYAMKGDKEEFIAGGCSHYISKPFYRDEFLKLIYEVLEIK
jgi:PAS domain S-box-containing protein